jgi:hypothetical protein
MQWSRPKAGIPIVPLLGRLVAIANRKTVDRSQQHQKHPYSMKGIKGKRNQIIYLLNYIEIGLRMRGRRWNLSRIKAIQITTATV